METLQPHFIVGIGGSAGALNAYTALLDALRPDMGMTFVVVAHMLPDASSHLAAILTRHTEMPVLVASHQMGIAPNHVYVIPPNADLTIENHAFVVATPRVQRGTQIDLFFCSLAEVYGACAIAIILSGYRSDGTKGCLEIKAKGGMIFAQDNSAEVSDMHSECADRRLCELCIIGNRSIIPTLPQFP